MKIKTDQPLQQNRQHITNKIAHFWNQTSEGWKKVWGQHIHHGYYEDNEVISPQVAQEKLIEKLTDLLSIQAQDKILDAGCGMGGSSIYLAKKYNAQVTGITLSNKQIDLASQAAKQDNLDIKFQLEDALALSKLGPETFDIIWSLESCEQFFDKDLFLQEAHKALKPNGQLMLATWCADREEYIGLLAKKYQRLCLAFDLPYMPTMDYYHKKISQCGFEIKKELNWTSQVKKSWEIGISLLNAYNFLQIIKASGWRGLIFSRQVKMMQEAFQQNRVRYGVFIAVKK